jgi:ABC-type Mn2+/Zn2+ transport system permease subunit
MHGYGGLASTGLGTITIGALVISQVWLVVGAFTLVIIGALLVRYTFRRNKTPKDQ